MQKASNSSEEKVVTYDLYNEFVDWTLDKQIGEYRLYILELHNTQLSVIKNYLWLSAMIAGAIAAVLATTQFSLATATAKQAILVPFLLFSIFLCLETFVRGTKLMIGDDYPVITNSYLQNINEALGDDKSNKTMDVKQNMVSEIQGNIDYLREIHSKKGTRIRTLNSNLVLATIISSIASLFLYVF